MEQPKKRERRRRRDLRRPESRCPECKHAIFDEIWGEYKCARLKRRIRNPEEHTGCKDYQKAE